MILEGGLRCVSLGECPRWSRLSGPHLVWCQIAGHAAELLALLDVEWGPGERVSRQFEFSKTAQVPWMVHFALAGRLIHFRDVVRVLRSEPGDAPMRVGVGFIVLDVDLKAPVAFQGRDASLTAVSVRDVPPHEAIIWDWFMARPNYLSQPSAACLPIRPEGE